MIQTVHQETLGTHRIAIESVRYPGRLDKWQVVVIKDGQLVMMQLFGSLEEALACESRVLSGILREKEGGPLDPKDWSPRAKRCRCRIHVQGG